MKLQVKESPNNKYKDPFRFLITVLYFQFLILVFANIYGCRTSEQQENDRKIQEIQKQRKAVEKKLKDIERKKEKSYILIEK